MMFLYEACLLIQLIGLNRAKCQDRYGLINQLLFQIKLGLMDERA